MSSIEKEYVSVIEGSQRNRKRNRRVKAPNIKKQEGTENSTRLTTCPESRQVKPCTLHYEKE